MTHNQIRITPPAARINLAISALCALSVLGWLALARRYALADYYLNPGFALDKIPFYSWTMQLTTLLLLLLCAAYAAIDWLLARAGALTWSIKLALIGLFAGAGIANVLTYPIGAIDLFSYLAQLKLPFYYHQNPYLTPFLPTYSADPLARLAAFLEWPIVYGPAWVVLAGWPLALVGFGDILRLLLVTKACSLLWLCLCGWCIARYHDDARSGWRAAYLLLANPLVLFEAVGNAHNDVIMAALLLAAVLAVKRRAWLALALLALAALTKAFAVVLLPVFLVALLRERRSWRWRAGALLLAGVVSVALIAPFWAGGALIAGLLHALQLQQAGIATISLLSLLQEYAALKGAAPALVTEIRVGLAGVFVAALLLVTARTRQLVLALVVLLVLAYVLVGSFLPWYLIPVIGLLALWPTRLSLAYVFVAAPLALLSYPVSIWARFESGLSLFQMRLILAGLVTLPALLLASAVVLRSWGQPPAAASKTRSVRIQRE